MQRILIAAIISTLLGGCVRRTLTVSTDPPGALVHLNDQEFGRSPVQRDFTWYGNYDVQVRKEGYQTLNTRGQVTAPWWQWPPFDLVADLLPLRLHDKQTLHYTLQPQGPAPSEEEMLSRAGEMQGQLESSKYTRQAP